MCCQVLDSAGTYSPTKRKEKKVISVEESLRGFLFGAWKAIFLGMRRLRFLSEDSWETVTFAFFILFLCYCLFYFFFNLHKPNHHTYLRIQG